MIVGKFSRVITDRIGLRVEVLGKTKKRVVHIPEVCATTLVKTRVRLHTLCFVRDQAGLRWLYTFKFGG